MTEEKRPVVLLMLQGVGLSTAWQGNALAVANPKNLARLWQNYPHAALATTNKYTSKVGFFSNSNCNYAAISCGRMVPTDFDEINEAIETGSFFENKVLNEAFDSADKQYSSVHLVGAVSADGFYGEIRHLFAFLELARKRHFFRVFVHLLIDTGSLSQDRVAGILSMVEAKLGQLNVGQIASVIAQPTIHDANYGQRSFTDSVKTIAFGRGSQSFSTDQTITRGFGNPKMTRNNSAFSITEGGQPVGVIKDYDSVIFFNHNYIGMKNFVASFLTTSVVKLPRGVSYYALTNPFMVKHERLQIITERQFQNTIIDAMQAADLRVASITEGNVHAGWNYFKGCRDLENITETVLPTESNPSAYMKKYEAHLQHIMSETLQRIKEGYEFIYVAPGCIDRVTNIGRFAHIAGAINAVDKYLGELEHYVLENRGVLIITSPFGKVEAISGGNQLHDWTAPSMNPVPFIVVSNEKKLKLTSVAPFKDQLLHELVHVRHSIADVAPVIERFVFGSEHHGDKVPKLITHLGDIE